MSLWLCIAILAAAIAVIALLALGFVLYDEYVDDTAREAAERRYRSVWEREP
jgi:hypothetical protein